MAKPWSSRVLLQVSTVVMTVFIACALSKLDTDCEADLSKSLHWIDTAQNLKVYFNVRNFEIYADSVMDGNSINNIIEFKYKQASVTQIITCKKLKGKKESYIDVHVLDHDDSTQLSLLRPDLHEKTYYLPYKPDTATYMHLGWHATPCQLFITDGLIGCDIWIADSVDLDKSTGPLIVHVNSDKHKIYEKPWQNLAHKETLAKKVLDHFNTNLNKNEPKYKFYRRISYNMIKAIDYEIEEETRKEKLSNVSEMKSNVTDYWEKADSKDYTSLYWFEEFGLFYGYYDTCNTTERRYGVWQFKLKDLKSGKLKKVEYKSNQSCKLEEIYTKLSKTCSKSRFQTDKCKFM